MIYKKKIISLLSTFSILFVPSIMIACSQEKKEGKLINAHFFQKWSEANSFKPFLYNNVDGHWINASIFEKTNDIKTSSAIDLKNIEKNSIKTKKFDYANILKNDYVEVFLKDINNWINDQINKYQSNQKNRVVSWYENDKNNKEIIITIGVSKIDQELEAFKKYFLDNVIINKNDIAKLSSVNNKSYYYLNIKYGLVPQVTGVFDQGSNGKNAPQYTPFYNMKILTKNNLSNIEWSDKIKESGKKYHNTYVSEKDLEKPSNIHSKKLLELYKKYNPKITNLESAKNYKNYDYWVFVQPVVDFKNSEFKIFIEFFKKPTIEFELHPIYSQIWKILKPENVVREIITLDKAIIKKTNGEKLNPINLGKNVLDTIKINDVNTAEKGKINEAKKEYFRHFFWDKIIEFVSSLHGRVIKGQDEDSLEDFYNNKEELIKKFNDALIFIKILNDNYPDIESLFSKAKKLNYLFINDFEKYKEIFEGDQIYKKVINKIENSNYSINELFKTINEYKPYGDKNDDVATRNKKSKTWGIDKIANLSDEDGKKILFMLIFIALSYDVIEEEYNRT